MSIKWDNIMGEWVTEVGIATGYEWEPEELNLRQVMLYQDMLKNRADQLLSAMEQSDRMTNAATYERRATPLCTPEYLRPRWTDTIYGVDVSMGRPPMVMERFAEDMKKQLHQDTFLLRAMHRTKARRS